VGNWCIWLVLLQNNKSDLFGVLRERPRPLYGCVPAAGDPQFFGKGAENFIRILRGHLGTVAIIF